MNHVQFIQFMYLFMDEKSMSDIIFLLWFLLEPPWTCILNGVSSMIVSCTTLLAIRLTYIIRLFLYQATCIVFALGLFKYHTNAQPYQAP